MNTNTAVLIIISIMVILLTIMMIRRDRHLRLPRRLRRPRRRPMLWYDIPYIYIYIYMCTHNVYMYIYIYTHICVYTSYIYIYIHIILYTYIYIQHTRIRVYIIYIYIYRERERDYRCLWKNNPLERARREHTSFQSTKWGAGLQFMLWDCRVRACTKGVLFFTDPLLLNQTMSCARVWERLTARIEVLHPLLLDLKGCLYQDRLHMINVHVWKYG